MKESKSQKAMNRPVAETVKVSSRSMIVAILPVVVV